MHGMTDILLHFIGTGTAVVCVLLVGQGILRWLGDVKARRRRLKIAAVIAAILLFCIFVNFKWGDIIKVLGDESSSEEMTRVFIVVSKIMVKLLMLGAIVGPVVVLLLFVYFCIRKVLKSIFQWEEKGGNRSLGDRIGNGSEEMKYIAKLPIVKFMITWGIMAVFIIMPLLMGEQKALEPSSMSETWKNGVYRIAYFVGIEEADGKGDIEDAGTGQGMGGFIRDGIYRVAYFQKAEGTESGESAKGSFFNALGKYILDFVIVLGVGFAAVQIVYSIIDNVFSGKGERSLLDEYSSSIGVLAVGVSLLWTIQDKDFLKKRPIEMITDCFKSFAHVVFIITLAILTLEIIRLLLDMREKLIRKEARHLFVSLVGQVTMLLAVVLDSIYGAVSNTIGAPSDNDAINRVKEKIKLHVVWTMEEHLEEHLEEGRTEEIKEHNTTFSRFDKKVTRK